MIRKIQSLFTLLLITTSLSAQTPFIRNFFPDEYKANTQNWAILQDQRGIMYFANSMGILEYDGVNWRIIATPDRARSLCIDSMGVIYVGCAGDFGYLHSDSIGRLKYISLKEKIPTEHNDFTEILRIVTKENKVIFKSANKLFILENDSITVLHSESAYGSPFVVHNNFYVEKKGEGLFYLENNSLRLSQGAEIFCTKLISAMLPYENDDILIAIREQGIYIYNPSKSPCIWKPDGFEAVDDFLIKNKSYCGVLLYDGSFAIGSITGGILVFDKQGKIRKHYNKLNGLQSNTSYYLFTDLNGQLWAALEDGISLIMNNLPFSFYTYENGLDGSVYSIQKFKNKLYIGTGNNLYVQNNENQFERIEGTTGQNFFLLQANEKLLLGNFPNGIFDINDYKAVQTTTIKLPSIVAIKLRKHPNNIITQAWNKGLAILKYENKQWVFQHFINGFNKNAVLIVEEDNGDFWIGADKLYKLRLNKTLDSVIFLQDFVDEKFHLPENRVWPFRLIKGEIIFSTSKGIYRYLSDKNFFEPHPDFSMFTEGVNCIKQDEKGNIWFEKLNNNISEKGVLRSLEGKYEIVKTPFLKFTERSLGTPDALYPYSDSLVYFGIDDGLLEYHPKQKANYDITFTTLIREVFVNDSLLYAGAVKDSISISDEPIILKYKDNNLIFHYSATFYEDSEKNLFSYRLKGYSDTTWSVWTNDHKKEYTNLYEGKYIFEVKSQNIYRKLGVTSSFAFEILPPWYRTWLAYSLYGILVIVFVWLLLRLNSARLKRHNELLKQIVQERTSNILEQKNEILQQKENIEKQAKELKISNEKLNILNSTKDKFFTIISHDLKSPFNSILGFASLLNKQYDSIDDVKKKMIINLLDKSSQSAFELLDNLLSWARTQTGRIEINKELLNLKELVETSIAPYKYNASQKNIEININVPSTPSLSLDRNTSMTFIGNLVNNAIKFTPEGGTITINYHENEEIVELHIIDTGVGMSQEVIGKLFRIDEDISTKGTNNEKGTGLGLILCKEFIIKNGGDISVISDVGKGSDFIITFSK